MGGNLAIMLIYELCKILHFFHYTKSFFESTASVISFTNSRLDIWLPSYRFRPIVYYEKPGVRTELESSP